MRVTKKDIQNNWLKIMMIIILGISALYLILILTELNQRDKTKNQFRQYIIDEKKQDLKTEVNNRFDEINYELKLIEERQKKIVKNKIDKIYRIMMKSHAMNITDITKRRRAGMELYSILAEDDPNYLYFSIDLKGNMLRSGTDESMIGDSLIDYKDIKGNYFVKEMVKIAKESGQGYITYYWPKTKDGKPKKKTSYFVYIPEMDMIIGTGVYEEDVLSQVQSGIYNRFQSYYEGQEDYIFIVKYDGIAKVFGNPDLLEKNVSHISDSKGVNIHNVMLDIVKKQGDGFVKYRYFERSTKIESEKIAYIREIPDWDAYMGMGFYLNDFDYEMTLYEKEERRHLMNQLISLLVAFVIIIFVILFYIKKGMNLSKTYLIQKDLIYEQFANMTTEGILIIDNYKKVKYMNPFAMNLIGIKNYKDEELDIDDMLKEHVDDVSIIHNKKGRDYYVEFVLGHIVYKNMDCKIYFIKNITDKYLYANELRKLALYDQLTSLPNRRKLLEDINKTILNDYNDKKVSLSMIDLDHFKDINDTYGHDVGDEVLVGLGEVFNNYTSENHTLYRYGGEEFVAILIGEDVNSSRKLLENINEKLGEYFKKQKGMDISFSAGLLEIDYSNIKQLNYYLKTLDNLLYKAKNNGRNRVESK